MNFYSRYESLCQTRGMDPCSQSTANALKITKATISSWNTKGTSPKGKTVREIADVLGTTADYLLGRTNDPSALTLPDAASPMKEEAELLLHNFARLDAADRMKVAAYQEGLLAGDKYM